VELAVLVDRGGRRLPIAASYCGLTITATDTEKVKVHLAALQPSHDSITILAAPAPLKVKPVKKKSNPSARALAS
jgi:pyrimidine operon attenuation protein/uracil phosphoribosyltransferase